MEISNILNPLSFEENILLLKKRNIISKVGNTPEAADIIATIPQKKLASKTDEVLVRAVNAKIRDPSQNILELLEFYDTKVTWIRMQLMSLVKSFPGLREVELILAHGYISRCEEFHVGAKKLNVVAAALVNLVAGKRIKKKTILEKFNVGSSSVNGAKKMLLGLY